MIAFIKQHKWWFIGGVLAVVVYWLYNRAQANAANANPYANVPAYPTVIYGGGGGVGGVSSQGTGTTGAASVPAGNVAAIVPAPQAGASTVGNVGAGGVTGSQPASIAAYNAPGLTADQARASAAGTGYLAYENSLYTKPQSQWGTYLGSGGNPNDPLYLQDVKLGTVAGQNPSNAGGFSDTQLAAWSQRQPAVPLDTSFQNGGLGFGGQAPVLSGSTAAMATPASPVTATVPSPDQATPAPIIDTYHLPIQVLA